jgi:single-strand DNA-binding protein
MFNDVNKVILMGNVTQDPDLRFTSGGTAVLNLSMATNRSYKVGDEWKDEVTFHNIVIWRSAEQLAKRIKKGTRIYVEGRGQTRSWEGTDGKKNYKHEVHADVVNLIARYEGGEMSGGSASKESDSAPAQDETAIEPDDLPF